MTNHVCRSHNVDTAGNRYGIWKNVQSVNYSWPRPSRVVNDIVRSVERCLQRQFNISHPSNTMKPVLRASSSRLSFVFVPRILVSSLLRQTYISAISRNLFNRHSVRFPRAVVAAGRTDPFVLRQMIERRGDSSRERIVNQRNYRVA